MEGCLQSLCEAAVLCEAVKEDVTLLRSSLIACTLRPWSAAPHLRAAMAHLCVYVCGRDTFSLYLDALRSWWLGPEDYLSWAFPWLAECLPRFPAVTKVVDVSWKQVRSWEPLQRLSSTMRGDPSAQFVAAYFVKAAWTEFVEQQSKSQDHYDNLVRFLWRSSRCDAVAPFVRRQTPRVGTDAFARMACNVVVGTQCMNLLVETLDNDPRVLMHLLQTYCVMWLGKKSFLPPSVCLTALKAEADPAFDAKDMLLSFHERHDDIFWERTRLVHLNDSLPKTCLDADLGAQVCVMVMFLAKTSILGEDTFPIVTGIVDRLTPCLRAACVARWVLFRPLLSDSWLKYSVGSFAAALEDEGVRDIWLATFPSKKGLMVAFMPMLGCANFGKVEQEQDIRACKACVAMLRTIDDEHDITDGFVLQIVVKMSCHLYGMRSADVGRLMWHLLVEWQEVVRAVATSRPLLFHQQSIINRLVGLVVDTFVPFYLAAHLDAGDDDVAQAQAQVLHTLISLCRVAELGRREHSDLLTAVDCLCVHAIRWASPVVLRACLEWLATVHSMTSEQKHCSFALQKMLLCTVEKLVAAAVDDPVTLEWALWCLQFGLPDAPGHMQMSLHPAAFKDAVKVMYAQVTDRVFAVLDRVMDRYGTRPRCIGACAACLVALPLVAPRLVNTCVTLAMGWTSEWALDLFWLQPVVHLFRVAVQLKDPMVTKKQATRFGLWVLDSVSGSVLCAGRIVNSVSISLYDVPEDDAEDIVMTLVRFVSRNADPDAVREGLPALPCWRSCWLTCLRRKPAWTSMHLRDVSCAISAVITAWTGVSQERRAPWVTDDVMVFLLSFVKEMMPTVRQLWEDCSDECGCGYVLSLYETLSRDIGRDRDRFRVVNELVQELLQCLKPFWTQSMTQWSPLRRAWILALVTTV